MSVGVVNKQTGDRIPTAGMPAIDNALDLTSVNPVQNAVITAALTGKADTGIVADDFDSTASYVIGNYCIENGKLYRFKANHSGAWSASDVEEIKIAGELSSIKSGLTTLDNEVNGDATVYPYADVITIPDAVPSNLADCSVKIEPVQDLHGQSAPYVGGAGKNKMPITLDGIKSLNNTGTWSGNVYTVNNGTITVNTDDGGNVTSIKVNGTFNANTTFNLLSDIKDVLAVGTDIIINGCPLGGGATRYVITANNVGNDTGDGVSGQVPSIVSKVAILIYASYNVDNLLFKPMIRLATETDATFAPYTNICPISGHTEVDVQRDGKNLLKATDIYDDATSQKIGTIQRILVSVENGTYTVSTNNALTDTYANVFCGDSSKYNTEMTTANNGVSNNAPRTVTITDGKICIGVRTDGGSVGTIITRSMLASGAVTIQLEKGSTATPFEPYADKTYTIALGDTIYGGTIRVENDGNVYMDVDRATVQGNTITWIDNTAQGYQRFRSYNVISGADTAEQSTDAMISCSEFDINRNALTTSDPADGLCMFNGYIYVRSSTTTTLSDFETLIADADICYTLATPFTVQLSDLHIPLLQGTNTLYASTGDISVTVNGVSGAIGSVQEQVNDHEERIEAVESGLTNLGTYSASPVKIGKWFNHDLYRLVINCGTLPNNTALTVSTGLQSSVNTVNVYGIAMANANCVPMPNALFNLKLYYDKDNNQIVIETDRDLHQYTGYVTIEYYS